MTALDLDSLYPVLVGRVLIRGTRMICDIGRNRYRLSAPTGLLTRLFDLCQGQLKLRMVIDHLGKQWDKNVAMDFVTALLQAGVLINARDYPHLLWSNLMATHLGGLANASRAEQLANSANTKGVGDRTELELSVAETPVNRLLKARKSHRAFSSKPVATGAIGAILWAGYGAIRRDENCEFGFRRTVCSAGALYPLSLFLVVFRTSEELECGIYKVCYGPESNVGLVRIGVDTEPVFRSFFDPHYCTQAQGAIVVVGDFSNASEQYGSRAPLFVSLEAGHAVQNILLCAQEQNIATLEIGGYHDKLLANALQLQNKEVVMSSVFIGQEDKNALPRQIVPDIAFEWVAEPAHDRCDFSTGRATIAAPGGHQITCWGRSRKPSLAHAKSIAEAQERLACTSPTGLIDECFRKLDDTLDPRKIVSYRGWQYQHANFRFHPFSINRTYQWKEGFFWENRAPVHILAEQVYFANCLPHSLGSLYTKASTSGVAAYPSLDGAFERAILEIIERDAFMMFWINKASPALVHKASLPANYLKKCNDFLAQGWHIDVCNLTLDTVPVLMLFAQNNAQGWTTVTTSADYIPEVALEHAFMEIESRIFNFDASDRAHSIIKPGEVALPRDHLHLYSQRKYFRRADFLAASTFRESFSKIKETSSIKGFDGLVDRLISLEASPICLNISLQHKLSYQYENLCVARAIVPGFVPLSFGYNSEPLGMHRLRQFKSILGLIGRRNQLNKPLFPHPFA